LRNNGGADTWLICGGRLLLCPGNLISPAAAPLDPAACSSPAATFRHLTITSRHDASASPLAGEYAHPQTRPPVLFDKPCV